MYAYKLGFYFIR